MLKFLEELLTHSDDIAYGAGTELYNRMVQDTEDRKRKFTTWGDQVQRDLSERKKSLQLQQSNYDKAINKLKTIPPEELNKDLLLKNIDIDTYLKPLASQLGTGMFLGDENEILNRITHFLKQSPIEKGTPYVPSENYFEQNFDKIDNQMQNISGMGYNTWRALSKKGELSMVEDTGGVEFKEDAKLKSDIEVSSISAKAFGILNTFPGTIEGNNNLQFVQTNLIVANSHTKFPDDLDTRADFINKKLFENNIEPMIALNYHNPVTFKQMSQVIDRYGLKQAEEIAELTNQMKSPELPITEKQRINDQINQLVLGQHKLMDEFSKTVPRILAGEDRSVIMGTGVKKEVIVPEVSKSYVPNINNKGELIVEYNDGTTQEISLNILINNPDNLKGIPEIAQDYILKIQDRLFEDGEMLKPTREMFNEGKAGDKAFMDFLEIYFELNPGERELHMEFSDWFEKEYKGTKTVTKPPSGTRTGPGTQNLIIRQDADITQFKTDKADKTDKPKSVFKHPLQKDKKKKQSKN